MPSIVVFDMDGLLFDTERLHAQAIVAAAGVVGCEFNMDLFGELVGTPWHANRTYLLRHYGPNYPVDEVRAEWMRTFRTLAETQIFLKLGAVELLDTLDALGVRRAIATSSSHAAVQHHLSLHGLEKRFDHVVADGDYAACKPAPDPFLTAAARFAVAPEQCLALEDSHNGVRSASAAGMMTIMVPDLIPATDEIAKLCTYVVSDLGAVRDLILHTAPESSPPRSTRPQ